MNGDHFDYWTRSRTLKISRRSMGVGALAAALSRFLPSQTGAQFDDEEACQYAVELTSSVTPGAVATAAMEFGIQENGAIETGSFVLEQNQPVSLVGQDTGQTIVLLIALPDGTMLSLTGQSETDVRQCESTLRGYFSNPESNQLGTWIAEPGKGAASGQSAQGAQPTPGSAASEAQSSCNAIECGASQLFDPQSCQCVCPQSTTPCGQLNCCDPGTSCLDPGDGLCSCAAGTQLCLNICVPECGDDETLNLTTCGCDFEQKQVCIEFGLPCEGNFECCSGYCKEEIVGNLCNVCIGKVCGDFLCVDYLTDNNHCGNCGVICINTTCNGGVCQ